MIEKDLVIIGGGSAGLAAAISAYDQGIRDLVILEKDEALGGILNQCIHNGFGLEMFKEQLSGPEYAHRFIAEIKKRDIAYKLKTTVLSFSADKVVTYSNSSEGLVQIKAKSIIYAMGCFERSAGAIMLPGRRLNGIFTAGTVQKYLNMEGYLVGKRVFILGSGDIGLIMARRMHLEGAQVLGVAEIMPYSNGLNRNIVQCLQDFDIPLYLSHTVKDVIGKTQVEKVTIVEVDEHQNYIANTEKTFDCDTLLLSVGLIPSSDMLASAGARMSPLTKSAEVNEMMETSIPGVFACGNVLHVHDLVDFVSAESFLAGQGAAQYIQNHDLQVERLLDVTPGNNISYVVPQKIRFPFAVTKVLLKFRVRKPLKNVTLYVKADGKIIKTVRKPFILPSEMEQIAIEVSLIPQETSTIVVEVGE